MHILQYSSCSACIVACHTTQSAERFYNKIMSKNEHCEIVHQDERSQWVVMVSDWPEKLVNGSHIDPAQFPLLHPQQNNPINSSMYRAYVSTHAEELYRLNKWEKNRLDANHAFNFTSTKTNYTNKTIQANIKTGHRGSSRHRLMFGSGPVMVLGASPTCCDEEVASCI